MASKKGSLWPLNLRFLPIIILFLVLILPLAAKALTLATTTQADFNAGFYNNTVYNTTGGFANLIYPNLVGDYTSKVLSVSDRHGWDNISWVEGVPYGENLPDSGATENVLGSANMNGNVLLLHLDENSGTSTVDTSGNNNTGAVQGASWTSGRLNSALSFNGVNSNVKVLNSPSLNPSTGFTVEMWINADNLKKGSQALVSKWEPGSGTFTNNISNSWQAIEANRTLSSNSFKGFNGGAFDGRYVYFGGNYNGGGMFGPDNNGYILRYDSWGNFTNNVSTSWQVMEINRTISSSGALQANSATFDGRYVYFTADNGNARILRYDTTGSFTNNASNSWQVIDTWSTLGLNYRYKEPVFDGKYVYFPTAALAGAIVRYDTTGSFTNNASNSWQEMRTNDTLNGRLTRWGGGSAYDGRYVYFAGNKTSDGLGTLKDPAIVRYDTTGSFTNNVSNSWQEMNATETLSSSFDAGFGGAVFDGRYVYFVPQGGDILRYDTTGSFTNNASNSWQEMRINQTLNSAYNVYKGGMFDGRYVYFVPQRPSATLLRYDTTGSFTNNASNSWQAINLSALDPTYYGYSGAVSDGKAIYLVPSEKYSNINNDYNGRILRYDSAGQNSSFSISLNSGGDGGGFGLTTKVVTAAGPSSISANSYMDTPVWHHIASTYDGTSLTLYEDGTQVASKSTTGLLQSSTADLIIGAMNSASFFNGTIDEVAIYNRSLSFSEMLDHYKRGAMNLTATIRTSPNNITWTEFRGIGNSTIPFSKPLSGNLSTFDNFTYVQYKFVFETINGNYTPQLYNITINYTNTTVALSPSPPPAAPASTTGGGGGGSAIPSTPTPKKETTPIPAATQPPIPQTTYDIALPVTTTSGTTTETYTATVISATQTAATVGFSSGTAAPVTLNVGQSGYVDLNNDGINDVKVTLSSISNGVPKLDFEVLPTGVKGDSTSSIKKIESNGPTGLLILNPAVLSAIVGLIIAAVLGMVFYRKTRQ